MKSAIACVIIVIRLMVQKTSDYASTISVRGSEPNGKLCAKGSGFVIIHAWSLSVSEKPARSLAGGVAEGFLSVHEDGALGTGRSYSSRLHQQ
jgi:hypothetical protein